VFKLPVHLTENGNIPLTRNKLNFNQREGFKICYVCRKEKTFTEFSNNAYRADKLQTYCKECGKERQSKWYYKRKHSLSLEERDSFLQKQNNLCAICGNITNFKLKQGHGKNISEEAVIDHDHLTGEIRGVLCGFCNTGLGAFKDNINSLKSAIGYLQDSVKV